MTLARSSGAPAVVGAAQPRPSVLIADDDEALCTHLVRAFVARGFEARAAHDYEHAMNLAAADPPEFAVVDLKLGRDQGLELLRDLLRVDPTTRVVVLTGYGSIATAVRAVRLGAIDYLAKPAHTDDLLAAFAVAGDPLATRQGEFNAPTLAQAEWEHINRVLADCGGNVTHAAAKLGIHRRSLQRKLARPPSEKK